MCPQTLQAGASLCIDLAAAFIASSPASALAALACFVFMGCTPLVDVLTTRTLDNSGELAYSKPEGTSSQSSVPVFNTSGLSNTCTRSCLLYTSDAADERSSVDLGGRRIIK